MLLLPCLLLSLLLLPLLLLLLLRLSLLLGPSLMQVVLLRSLPWLWLPRLSLLQRGRHRSDANRFTPGRIDAGAASPPS